MCISRHATKSKCHKCVSMDMAYMHKTGNHLSTPLWWGGYNTDAYTYNWMIYDQKVNEAVSP